MHLSSLSCNGCRFEGGDFGCGHSQINSILNPCLSTDLWCLQRVKNKITLGTLEEAAFQLSLRWRNKPEDPLAVPLFSDVLYPTTAFPTGRQPRGSQGRSLHAVIAVTEDVICNSSKSAFLALLLDCLKFCDISTSKLGHT